VKKNASLNIELGNIKVYKKPNSETSWCKLIAAATTSAAAAITTASAVAMFGRTSAVPPVA